MMAFESTAAEVSGFDAQLLELRVIAMADV
jgi:hypothetical protein